MPEAVRFDNGSPFASTSGPHGLSRLGVWLLTLGIRVERMRPGHPEQNAMHERMHGVLAKEVIPRAFSFVEECVRLEDWRKRYNTVRPHEGIGMQRPGSVYRSSSRSWSGEVVPWQYPAGWEVRTVRKCGMIKLDGAMLFVSEALRGQKLGLEPVELHPLDGQEETDTMDGAESVTPERTQSVTPRRQRSAGRAIRLWFRGLDLGLIVDGALEPSWKQPQKGKPKAEVSRLTSAHGPK